ncbi:MAG: hypothetical protein NT062_19005 [Proteobacteria bacterium]|nr:hypothetical protein [Pseudomonadota bacterium]
MRTSLLVIVVLIATSLAQAKPDDPDQSTLDAKALRKYFEPYVPAVKECYRASAQGAAPTGALRLELTIHRDGSVFRFGFVAPGITGGNHRTLDGCLRKLSETWHFPVRSGFTTAIIPFQFQRTP